MNSEPNCWTHRSALRGAGFPRQSGTRSCRSSGGIVQSLIEECQDQDQARTNGCANYESSEQANLFARRGSAKCLASGPGRVAAEADLMIWYPVSGGASSDCWLACAAAN